MPGLRIKVNSQTLPILTLKLVEVAKSLESSEKDGQIGDLWPNIYRMVQRSFEVARTVVSEVLQRIRHCMWRPAEERQPGYKHAECHFSRAVTLTKCLC